MHDWIWHCPSRSYLYIFEINNILYIASYLLIQRNAGKPQADKATLRLHLVLKEKSYYNWHVSKITEMLFLLSLRVHLVDKGCGANIRDVLFIIIHFLI